MKSKDRVPRGYKEGTDDWNAEYNMLLNDGVTCKDCAHCTRCCGIFGQNETDTRCQFYPNRFAWGKIPNSVVLKAHQIFIDSAVRPIETPTLCILGSRCDCRYNHDGCATEPAPEHLPCMGTVCGRYEQRRAM